MNAAGGGYGENGSAKTRGTRHRLLDGTGRRGTRESRKTFNADAVHDLRVALRRCRSMAEGFQSLNGDPSWGKMRKAGKVVFSALGELRDTQVLMEWIERLRSDCPAVAQRLKSDCLQREAN